MANRFSIKRGRAWLALVVGLVTLAVAPASQAALLPNLLPGVLSPAEATPTCDNNFSHPFQPWNDSASYVLMPGGSFESGGQSWTLGSGARVVSGNESYYVHSSSDGQSLYLPAGASVKTPAMCFAFGNWSLRMFAKRAGSTTTKVHVDVVVSSLLGIVSSLDGGTFTVGSTWQPTNSASLLLSQLGGLLTTDSISFRLTAVGGAVQIDDAYLDPFYQY